MSEENLLMEMQNLNHSNDSNNIYNDPQNYLKIIDISNISNFKITNYSFLCKNCSSIPKIKFFKDGKMRYICDCEESPRDLNIQDVYNLLYYSEQKENDYYLNCKFHQDEKYILYCKSHEKNLCFKCIYECVEHLDKLEFFGFDEKTLNKSEYLKNMEIKDESFDKKEKDFENDNSTGENIIVETEVADEISCKNNNIESDINNFDENEKIIIKEKRNNMNEEDKNEILNIILNLNQLNEEKVDDYKNYKSFITIIIDNYRNHPHHNLIETISNLEKYITFSRMDYNEIKLNYEFKEENIKDNLIDLFGEQFVNNNKENCFLIIKDKIMDLNQSIKLTDIFDNIPNNYPIKLNVQLIERKSKIMTNLSYMFYSISTITSKSNFDGYDSSNITSLSYMFCNCKFIEYLPDISKLNTKSVTDISYMFFNCSSLKELPDISKWNTENVINANNMFENCSSITSLPDISRWNIEKIKYMNYMFKNCISIPNIKESLNWNISEGTQTFNMFEGIRLNLNNEDNILIMNFNKIFNQICSFFNRFNNNKCGVYCLVILFVILIIGYLCLPLIPFYNSFNLNNLKLFVNKSTSNIVNYTDINYIASIYNLTNSDIIENKEYYINNLLNFTNK